METPVPVRNGPPLAFQLDEAIGPHGLKNPVDVHRRNAERIADLGLGNGPVADVAVDKPHRSQAHQHLAQKMRDARIGVALPDAEHPLPEDGPVDEGLAPEGTCDPVVALKQLVQTTTAFMWPSMMPPAWPYVEVLPDETRRSTTAFLVGALRWFKARSIRVERVMTDNGSGYVARLFRKALRMLKIRHIRTRPYKPKTNGKAERFIQTLLREWAYTIPFSASNARAADLPRWLTWYNQQRPHGSLGRRTPAQALAGTT